MGDTNNAVLQYLHAYGPVTLAVALLLSGIGIPVPASLLVIAAGALAGQGRISLPLAFGLAVLGAVAGSIVSYAMGRYGLEKLIARLRKGHSWQRAEQKFKEKAASAVILTRFLITPLALPTNLIAGGEKYPLVKFAVQCAIGNAIYVLLYGGLGYAFGNQWKRVAAQAGQWGIWVVLGAGVLFAMYELFTHWRGHLTAPPGPPAAQKG